MKAFILAAGLGTRLKPWTLTHPKALVPVGGTPMLQHIILSLKCQGFTYIVVNVHHFADQIKDFLTYNNFGVDIHISDETDLLLDTGGALVAAAPLLCKTEEPFLVHNVDILTDADLATMMEQHSLSGAQATLLVSDRDSSRRLSFDEDMNLKAWQNTSTGQTRGQHGDFTHSLAFSGIHVVNPSLVSDMKRYCDHKPFPVMDYYLAQTSRNIIKGHYSPGLKLIDIGKPETLARANAMFD